MNRTTVYLGASALAGVLAAALAMAACGGDKSNETTDGGGSGSSGGSSGSGSSGGSSSGGAGGACNADQRLCVGALGRTCLDAGAPCFGTTVTALQCSANEPCPGGQVCCSAFVGSDGGLLYASDAGGGGGTMQLNVAVQCMTECPANSSASQVCSLDGGSASTCPDGTSCRNYLPSFLATPDLPNTLCLPPLPEGGAFRFDGGFARDAGGGAAQDASAE
jgi:hypothetical protein